MKKVSQSLLLLKARSKSDPPYPLPLQGNILQYTTQREREREKQDLGYKNKCVGHRDCGSKLYWLSLILWSLDDNKYRKQEKHFLASFFHLIWCFVNFNKSPAVSYYEPATVPSKSIIFSIIFTSQTVARWLINILRPAVTKVGGNISIGAFCLECGKCQDMSEPE